MYLLSRADLYTDILEDDGGTGAVLQANICYLNSSLGRPVLWWFLISLQWCFTLQCTVLLNLTTKNG